MRSKLSSDIHLAAAVRIELASGKNDAGPVFNSPIWHICGLIDNEGHCRYSGDIPQQQQSGCIPPSGKHIAATSSPAQFGAVLVSLSTKVIEDTVVAYPTAAVKLRLPVARMMLVMSAATTVAPSFLISATRCAKTFRIRLATLCRSPGLESAALGLHSHLHRFLNRVSA